MAGKAAPFPDTCTEQMGSPIGDQHTQLNTCYPAQVQDDASALARQALQTFRRISMDGPSSPRRTSMSSLRRVSFSGEPSLRRVSFSEAPTSPIPAPPRASGERSTACLVGQSSWQLFVSAHAVMLFCTCRKLQVSCHLCLLMLMWRSCLCKSGSRHGRAQM